MSFVIEHFHAIHKNALRGFVQIRMPSGLSLHDVGIYYQNGVKWASPPSKPMIGKDGVVMRDADGKTRYTPMASFATKEARDRWSQAVVEAVDRSYPEALAG